MKHISSLMLAMLILVSANTFAQTKVDRSKAPSAGPAPKIQIGKSQTFILDNGLKVIVVEDHKLPVINYGIVFNNQPINERAAAGYIDMTGAMLSKGTKNRTKDQINEEIEFLGANLSASGNGIFGSSLTKHSGKLMAITADMLLNPLFLEEELEKLKFQEISGLKSQKNEPNAILANVSSVVKYGKQHPYGEVKTEETVNAITIDLCQNYYNVFFRPNNATMTIVGDITLEEAKTLCKSNLNDWEAAEYQVKNRLLSNDKPDKTKLIFVDKPNAVQSLIQIGYPIEFNQTNEDYFAATVMNNILGGGAFGSRLVQQLRENKAFTYGANSSLRSDKYIGSFSATSSVRNAVTDSAIFEFFNEFKKIREVPVEKAELEKFINYITGSFARSLENPQTIANFAVVTERYGLETDFYPSYLQRIAAVTPQQIQAAAQKYIDPSHCYIFVVGNKADLKNELQKWSKEYDLHYYDNEGNEIKEAQKPVNVGVTTQSVISNYINYIGGVDKLKKIKNVTTKSEGKMNFGESIMMLDFESVKVAPLFFKETLHMNSQLMQKRSYNGEKATSFAFMQGDKEITGKELEDLLIESAIVPELVMEQMGAQLALEAYIAKVNNEEAYQLNINLPSGKKITQYYSIATGAKLKEVQVADSQAGPGTVTIVNLYSDYKEVNGIKFPYKINSDLGGQMVDINVKSIVVNQKKLKGKSL